LVCDEVGRGELKGAAAARGVGGVLELVQLAVAARLARLVHRQLVGHFALEAVDVAEAEVVAELVDFFQFE